MKHSTLDTGKLVEKMKWEVAKELGIEAPADGDWGDIPSEDIGRIFAIVRKRVREIRHQQRNK